MTPIEIKKRLNAAGVRFHANDNIFKHLLPGDVDAIEASVTEKIEDLLGALIIDTKNDHNTRQTASRVARMMVREVFAGRYEPTPCITDFPNAAGLDEIYVVGPITIRSACSHHLVPILGKAWVGVIPTDRVIGLSKFNRLAHWIFSRPQIQEEAVVQLADILEEAMSPSALGVIVKATHHCGCWRGVKDETMMTTSVMRGFFRTHPEARAELMQIISGMGF